MALSNGRLDLHFLQQADRTQLKVRVQTPPLRVIRAFPLPDGAALAHLHNVSGGVLGGDQLSLTVQVDPGAQAQITTTGATRVYRHRAGYPAAQQWTQITIGAGGLLEYLPDALIPFAQARFCQQTVIDLADGAGLFYWEVLAPGRVAAGERFAYEQVQIKLDITAAGEPLLLERALLEPKLRPAHSLLRWGPYSYAATLYVLQVGPTQAAWLQLEATLAQLADQLTDPAVILWGVSTLTAHGLTVRALSHTPQAINYGLQHFWQLAKQQLYQRDALAPRKLL